MKYKVRSSRFKHLKHVHSYSMLYIAYNIFSIDLRSSSMSFNMQVFIISSLPFILVLVFLKSYIFTSKRHKNLPPSPPKLPLLGNLHQLGSSSHRSLCSMAQTYGPVMLIHFGSVPAVVASSADAAREVMKTQDLTFANRPYLRIPSKIFYASKDIAFSQYGEHWRQIRSIAVLHILSNKRVQSYRHVREEETTILMEKIRNANGTVVNLSNLLILLTTNIFCRVALGRKYEGRQFKNLLERTVEFLGCFSVGTYIPSLTWVDRLSGLERRVDEVAKEFDEFFDSVINEHKKNKVATFECQDLVGILLDIQRENKIGFPLEDDVIKAIILDLFVGGIDTTFTSLEWAVAELLRHPQAMKELQQEALKTGEGRSLITEDKLEKMSYLKAVMKETLRLHPPIPLLVPHESTQDAKLQGYDIPSGTRVYINAFAIGRETSKWEEPDEFRPERFLNNPIDYKGFHFELLPFGAGRRGCPGIPFAMIVNELVLANLVYKFDLSLIGDEALDMSETNGIAVHKKCPILVSATPSCY